MCRILPQAPTPLSRQSQRCRLNRDSWRKLALTSGNAESLSGNFALDVAYGRKTWRTAEEGQPAEMDSPRVFAFARIEHLHDTFKRIDYTAKY